MSTFDISAMDADGNKLSGTMILTPATTAVPPPDPAPASQHSIAVVITNLNGGAIYTVAAMVGDDATQPSIYLPLKDSSGNAHPGLTAWFYADGVDVGCTRFDNAYDYLNCSITVSYDGLIVFSQSPVNFYRGCRQKTIRYGAQVPFGPLDKSLLPNYAPGQQAAFNDSKKDYTYNGLGMATYKEMGTTGDRADIGYLPTWDTAFVTNSNSETFSVCRRAADNSGVWPCYWSDPVSGGLIDVIQYPNATTLPESSGTWKNNPIVLYGGSYDGPILTPPPNKERVTGCPYAWDEAHETGYNFLCAMTTGSARDYEHVSFWANNVLICFNPTYRQQYGIFQHYQVRGTAWALRSLFLGAYLSSNSGYFSNQLNVMLGLANAIPKNQFGLIDTYYGETPAPNGPGTATALWEGHYVRFVLDVIAAKLPEWENYAAYLGTLIPQILAGNTYPLATVYSWTAKDSNHNFLPSILAMMAISLQGSGWTAAQADAATAIGVTLAQVYALMQERGFQGKLGDFLQYDAAAGGYPALVRAAAICAVNAGVTGAEAAWQVCETVPTQPDYSQDWRFNIIPRN